MLRLGVPMLAGLFALGACASDADVEVIGQDEGSDPHEAVNPFSLAPGDPIPVDPEEPPARVSLEEEEAEFQRMAHTPLSDEERLKVERVLDATGVAPDEVAFVGELVLQRDVYTHSDELLALADAVVEKGRIISRIFTSTTGTPGPAGSQLQVSPELYARMNNGTFQFYRPYVQHFTAFIVPTDNFLLSLFQLITGNVNSAANDCLTANGTSGTLRAGTVANFNALSATEQARIPRVTVTHGSLETVCPGATALDPDIKGCSLAMRHRSLLHLDGVTRSTMTIGPRIGLVNTAVTGLGGLSRRVATHELLHTLGVAHPSQSTADGNSDGQPDAIVVPGTSSAANTISVMQNECSAGTNCSVANPPVCCNTQSNDMTIDDIDVIDTLYSPQAGGNCTYLNDFRNIAAN